MNKQVFENLLKKLGKDTLGEFKKYKLEYKVKGEIKKLILSYLLIKTKKMKA